MPTNTAAESPAPRWSASADLADEDDGRIGAVGPAKLVRLVSVDLFEEHDGRLVVAVGGASTERQAAEHVGGGDGRADRVGGNHVALAGLAEELGGLEELAGVVETSAGVGRVAVSCAAPRPSHEHAAAVGSIRRRAAPAPRAAGIAPAPNRQETRISTVL